VPRSLLLVFEVAVAVAPVGVDLMESTYWKESKGHSLLGYRVLLLLVAEKRESFESVDLVKVPVEKY